MTTLADLRKQYPQYEDLSDQDLADALYAKSYSDMPREEFDRKLGLQSSRPPVSPILERTLGLELDPSLERGNILPLARTSEDELVPAYPQIVIDMLESFTAPGRAMQGEVITLEEAMKFILDFGIPMSTASGTTRLGRTMTRIKSRRKVIGEAESIANLKAANRAKYKEAEAAGIKLPADDFVDFLARTETTLADEDVTTLTRGVFPKLSVAVDSLNSRLGQELNVRELQNVRKSLARAAGSADANEARIASKIMEDLDDTVDVISTLPKEARALWHKAMKAQKIERIIETAEGSKTGFETGLRSEFRKLLDPDFPKRRRGFDKDEIAIMGEIRDGTFTQNVLGWLSKFSPHNVVDAGVGVGGGGTVGGYYGGVEGAAIGAVAVPAVGAAARVAAKINTRRKAAFLRALTTVDEKRVPKIWELPIAAGKVSSSSAIAAMGLPEIPPMTQEDLDSETFGDMLRRFMLEDALADQQKPLPTPGVTGIPPEEEEGSNVIDMRGKFISPPQQEQVPGDGGQGFEAPSQSSLPEGAGVPIR